MIEIALESLLITEEEWIATEGVAGSVVSLVKHIGLALGLSVVTLGALTAIWGVGTMRENKALMKRIANRTPEELLSEKNFNETWVPEFNRFLAIVASDLEKADKAFHAKDYLVPPNQIGEMHATNRYTFDIRVCSVNLDNISDSDEDDPLIEGTAQKIYDMIRGSMKPYISRWERLARRYEPFFKMMIYLEEPGEEYNIYFKIVLRCMHSITVPPFLGAYILKEGLPPFKK